VCRKTMPTSIQSKTRSCEISRDFPELELACASHVVDFGKETHSMELECVALELNDQPVLALHICPTALRCRGSSPAIDQLNALIQRLFHTMFLFVSPGQVE